MAPELLGVASGARRVRRVIRPVCTHGSSGAHRGATGRATALTLDDLAHRCGIRPTVPPPAKTGTPITSALRDSSI